MMTEVKKQMGNEEAREVEAREENEEECGCGCHRGYGGRHGWYGHHRRHGGFGFPLVSIEEEVKALEEMKEALEGRLEIVNKRIEVLKR